MKIVLIGKDELMKVGGIGIFTDRLYEYLKNQNHEVHIIRFSNKVNAKKNTLHIPYYIANHQTGIFVPTEDSLSLFKKYLLDLNPDIVYTPIGLSPLDLFIPTICHDQGIPIVGVWHVDLNKSDSSHQILLKSIFLAYTPICKQLDLLHVFTNKLAKFYLNKGMSPNKILTLPNGINAKVYNRKGGSKFAKKNKIEKGILFLGRLTMDKNPEILIKSFLSLDPPVGTKLVLVGPGDQEEFLRSEYKDERILFTGLIDNEENKIDIMSSCNIFVLPSRFEGMPLALLEAMSCELACIASDAGSNGEVLGDSGIIITHSLLKNQLPLVLKILLDYPVLENHLAKKARERILKYYSEEIILNKLSTSLKSVAANFKKKNYAKQHFDINKKLFNKVENLWRRTRDYLIQE